MHVHVHTQIHHTHFSHAERSKSFFPCENISFLGKEFRNFSIALPNQLELQTNFALKRKIQIAHLEGKTAKYIYFKSYNMIYI